MYCTHCNNDPCHREEYEGMLRAEALCNMEGVAPPNALRRMLYRTYVRAAHGMLGAGHRIRIPACVRGLIRDIHPDPNGAYMGHKDKPAPDDGDNNIVSDGGEEEGDDAEGEANGGGDDNDGGEEGGDDGNETDE